MGAISKAPIRRVMRNQGASLVAGDAVDALIAHLESWGGDVTRKAIEIAEGDKRKRITADDIEQAIKSL